MCSTNMPSTQSQSNQPQMPRVAEPRYSPATWGFTPVSMAAGNLLRRTAPQQMNYGDTFSNLFKSGNSAMWASAIYQMFNPQAAPRYPAPPLGGGQQPGGGPPNSQIPGGGSQPSRPSWGGWAWGNVPVDNVIRAGFDWFEVGYPETISSAEYARMRNAGVTPFAYINLGEMHPDHRGVSGYSGPILRQNGDWGTSLVDVTHQSWQNWLYNRAMEAYNRGARGIKWDVATPDVPPGRTRADVNQAIASVMQRIRSNAPDMQFVFNQGFDFAKAYPQYVNGIQTEGLFSASSYPDAYLAPWKDPWYWGPQYNDIKDLAARGVPVFVAEYADPWSSRGQELYNAIQSQGFIPYITSENWQTRGRGYNINPGW